MTVLVVEAGNLRFARFHGVGALKRHEASPPKPSLKTATRGDQDLPSQIDCRCRRRRYPNAVTPT